MLTFFLLSFVVALATCLGEKVSLGNTIPCVLDDAGLATPSDGNCQVDGYVGSNVIFEDDSVRELCVPSHHHVLD